MVDSVQMKAFIKKVLNTLNPDYASSEAVDLVFGTGMVESNYTYIRQMGKGKARGFWQVEVDSALDNINSFIKFRPALLKLCSKASGIDQAEWTNPSSVRWNYILEGNMHAGIIHCRIKYRRVPDPLSMTVKGMAYYWKKYYNTKGGKGKEQDFIHKWEKLQG